MTRHDYAAQIVWTGNLGHGTVRYTGYARDYDVRIHGKPVLVGSADPAFRGDAARHNPEELLLAALSSCHMLWYLHLSADAGVVVTEYVDDAQASMVAQQGGGRFSAACLRPRVTLAAGSDAVQALALHEAAHQACYIARSVNFPVHVQAHVTIAG